MAHKSKVAVRAAVFAGLFVIGVLLPGVGGGSSARADAAPVSPAAPGAVANDDFDQALVIDDVFYTNTQDVIKATLAADDPVLPCVGSKKYNSVWYRFTPSANDTLIFSTDGSNYGPDIAVWTGARGSLANKACSGQSRAEVAVAAGTTYFIEIVRGADIISPPPTAMNLALAVWPASTHPASFAKTGPANGAGYQPAKATLSWDTSAYAASYAYCYDTTDNDACDTSWNAATSKEAILSSLSLGATYYWQVRATNSASTVDADSGAWWSFTTARASDLNHWTGTVTETSKPTAFDVHTDGTHWLNFTFSFAFSGCNTTGTAKASIGGPGVIAGRSFSYHDAGLAFNGSFPTATTAEGRFSLTNYPVCVWIQPGYCCWDSVTTSGAWTATGPDLPPVPPVYTPLQLSGH